MAPGPAGVRPLLCVPLRLHAVGIQALQCWTGPEETVLELTSLVIRPPPCPPAGVTGVTPLVPLRPLTPVVLFTPRYPVPLVYCPHCAMSSSVGPVRPKVMAAFRFRLCPESVNKLDIQKPYCSRRALRFRALWFSILEREQTSGPLGGAEPTGLFILSIRRL